MKLWIRAPEGHLDFGPLPDAVFAAAAWSRGTGRSSEVTLVVHGPDHHPRWTGWIIVPDGLPAEVHRQALAARTVEAFRPIAAQVRAVRCSADCRPRVILLDRDGTIIVDRHYLADPADIAFLPGAIDGLRRMASNGQQLVIVSNQSGIGRGRITRQQVDDVNGQIDTLLEEAGVKVEGIYICPHAPEDGCDCRKPATGMARRAEMERGLDLSSAVVVGDKASDVGLALQLGVPSFLVLTGEGAATLAAGECVPDYVVEDLAGVARICASSVGLVSPTSLPGLS